MVLVLVLAMAGVRWQRRKRQQGQQPGATGPRLAPRLSYEESDDEGQVWRSQVRPSASPIATAESSATEADTSATVVGALQPGAVKGLTRSDSFIRLAGPSGARITQWTSSTSDSTSDTTPPKTPPKVHPSADEKIQELEPDDVPPEGGIDRTGQYVDVKRRESEAQLAQLAQLAQVPEDGIDRKGQYVDVELRKKEEDAPEQSRQSYISVGFGSPRPSMIANPTFKRSNSYEGALDDL